ncbi:MAG: NAD(P)/FAD-dependent oxidoreductase [Candidatus Paceibacterota bacterium]|jgi:hypothetical protein
MFSENEKYDCMVIGGGPAGMMAAIRVGELQGKVLLLEKNKALGEKLLLTGDSRCNISHLEKSNKDFSLKYGKQGDFLLSSFSVFGPKKTFEFFEKNGLPLNTENDGRIFPKSNKAMDVLSKLTELLGKNKVDILLDSEVKDFVVKNNRIEKIILNNGIELVAKNYILTTGGKSYSFTGSDGSGFVFAKKIGHSIMPVCPALSPIKLKEAWVRDLAGISLQGVAISFFQNGKRILKGNGSILFTHFGITGPVILNISNAVSDYTQKGEIMIFLDLFPNKSMDVLKNELIGIIEYNGNRSIKNILNYLLPEKICLVVLSLCNIDTGKKGIRISKSEILKIVKSIKNIELNFDGLMGFDVAMVTKGGVSLSEIDSKTMKSKLIKNLYFAGELIDLVGISGGYNLQLCWTTGYVAGSSAIND